MKNDHRKHKVSQANSLIEARYTLTMREQKLLLAMIGQIQPKDDDFHEYEIRVTDFMELMGLRSDQLYLDAVTVVERLMGRVLRIPQPDGKLLLTHWVSSAMCEEGMISVRFDPAMKPYLLSLRNRFTSYQLGAVATMRSQYSIRVYQLLKQYEPLKERQIAIDDLRAILGLETEYPAYADFKRRVILAAQQEINHKTDLSFTFREIKQGRKVVEIQFRIEKRNKPSSGVPPLPKRQSRTAEEKATAKVATTQMQDILKGKAQ